MHPCSTSFWRCNVHGSSFCLFPDALWKKHHPNYFTLQILLLMLHIHIYSMFFFFFLAKILLYDWAEPTCLKATHPVPQVIHAHLVAMEPHGGLQVVHVDEPQVLLPQFPAGQVLTLKRRGRDGVRQSWTMLSRSLMTGINLAPRPGISYRASSSTAPSGGPGCCPA